MKESLRPVGMCCWENELTHTVTKFGPKNLKKGLNLPKLGRFFQKFRVIGYWKNWRPIYYQHLGLRRGHSFTSRGVKMGPYSVAHPHKYLFFTRVWRWCSECMIFGQTFTLCFVVIPGILENYMPSKWYILVTSFICFVFIFLQGVVGSLTSGKSALVHRYLTGSYMQEESPEGRSVAEANHSIVFMSLLKNNCDISV